MTTVNALNPKIDQTVQIYDHFYNYEQTVPVDTYDIVLSFFKSVFANQEAAYNFTVALFRVAYESNTEVLTLLQEMQGQDAVQLNITMAYYLNGLRSSATLLGVLEPTAPNYYVARNVRQ